MPKKWVWYAAIGVGLWWWMKSRRASVPAPRTTASGLPIGKTVGGAMSTASEWAKQAMQEAAMSPIDAAAKETASAISGYNW